MILLIKEEKGEMLKYSMQRLYVKRFRNLIQFLFLLLIIYGGYRLWAFVAHFVSGGPYVERAPMVEGFLPIGALMSLKVLLTQGIFDNVHPAGLVIFISAISLSLLFRKAFCGWICPVGTISEWTYRVGGKIVGKNLKMPKGLDYAFRSLKYLLLGFFLFIVIKMSPAALASFLGGPYWKIADVKMLWFFEKMSALTGSVLIILFAGSLLYRNFWCRYLCPYGALLGLLSLLSPAKVKRDEKLCIQCGKCVKSCPSLLPVQEKIRIKSPECTGCLNCVSVCPARGALDVKIGRKAVRPILYSGLLLVFFLGMIWGARLTGHWQTSVSYSQYRELIPITGQLQHP